MKIQIEFELDKTDMQNIVNAVWHLKGNNQWNNREK